MDEPSADSRSPLGEAVAGPKVDRDLMFARVEQRLLGRSLTPVRVGRFVVLERIGHGGMGVVYAAHDPQLERKVAVKIVDDGFGGDGTPQAHQELLREARAAAVLTHPHVVTVYEVGVEGDAVFLAMEFVDGPTLRGWLGAERRTWREIVTMFVAAARGLSAAHAAGLVHRDFKPDNVLIGTDGRPRVADFGLARPAPRERTDDGVLPPGDDTFTSVAGTPRYMAPEQHEGQGIGPASDQFALCVALYEALFGRHPFEADTMAAMIRRVMAGVPDPPGPAAKGVPPGVSRLVLRGLSADPAERHPSVETLGAGLRRCLRRRRRVALALGAVGVASAAALVGYRAAPESSVDPCARATAPMEARWNPARAQAIEDAFVATGRPGGAETAALVTDKLDRYAGQWSAIRQESCERAQVEGQRSELVMELSYACLDRRLEGLGLLLDMFGEPTPQVVGRAAQAVDELAPLARCGERRALLARGGNVLSETSDRTQPGIYERWHELSEDYHRAEAMRSMGRTDEAKAEADRIIAVSSAEGLRGLEAAALGLRARIELQRSEWDDADADLRRAMPLALAGELDDVAVEALLARSRLARERRQELGEVGVLLDMARGFVERPPRSEALALRVAVEQARVDRLQRRYDVARDGLQAALAEAESLGPEHTTVLSARNDLAANLVALGQLEEAETIFEELLPRRIAAKGPAHRSVGTLLLNLGAVAHNRGRWEPAVDYYTRALELYEARDDAKRSETVRFRLGVLRREQGRLDDAVASFERVLADRGERKGPEHADLAEVLEALAEAERQQGRLDAATEHAQRALALLERAHGPEYLDLRAPLTTLGKIELDRQRPAEAEAVLRRAHALVYATEVDGFIRAEVCFDLARALDADPLQKEEASTLAREAARLSAEAGERAGSLRQEIDAWVRDHGG